MICFGPVPSRRLGLSLGINNISQPKVCSFSCRYCQIGITKKYSLARNNFHEPETIHDEVKKHLSKLSENDQPDYLTFVASGEPTLDINLGRSIELLKPLGIPVAVITNASLLKNQGVREALLLADWVSVKVDANDAVTWEAINWPSHLLNFERHIEGIKKFASEYKGKLVTETMLISGVNDRVEDAEKTAKLLAEINPGVAYISVPTRPPAIASVKAPDETAINSVFQVFKKAGLNAELMLGFEGTGFGVTGSPIDDIVDVCTVHPLREDSMEALLEKNHADHSLLDVLIHGKYIEKVRFGSNDFYIRKFHNTI